MKFGAAFWVQRTDWPSLRDAVVAAEAAGFDSLWIDDHLLCDEGPPEAPKLEGWTVAAALAPLTSRATIGHLVTANTFRNPGLLAKMTVTLDQLSAGRAVLGIGGGWFEREHDAFGLEFGAGFGERLDRLAEAVGLIRRLLDGERVTHDGRFYRFQDALCEPRPLQAHLPILIGGSGPKKTLPLVARVADMWNAYGTPETLASSMAIIDELCRAIGRDPATIERSATQNVVIRDTVVTAQAAYEDVRRAHQPQPGEDLLDVGGPPEVVAEALRAYADAGIDHSIWIFRSPWDTATISRLAEVRTALAERA